MRPTLFSILNFSTSSTQPLRKMTSKIINPKSSLYHHGESTTINGDSRQCYQAITAIAATIVKLLSPVAALCVAGTNLRATPVNHRRLIRPLTIASWGLLFLPSIGISSQAHDCNIVVQCPSLLSRRKAPPWPPSRRPPQGCSRGK